MYNVYVQGITTTSLSVQPLHTVLSHDSKLDVVPHYGVIMKITGSSAIAHVNFKDDSQVGIIYTSQPKEYMFKATDIDLVTREVTEANADKNLSVGKLINGYRSSGQLTEV